MKKSKLAGKLSRNHHMYLYGKNSILERLKANPQSIRKIFLQDNFKDAEIERAVKSVKIPVSRVSENELLRIKRADRLQGIVAEADKFQYTPFEKLLHLPENERPTFIFLDSLNDPHNLGTIMRTAACFGGFAIVIPEHGSCEVNETVLHVSSGAENYVPVSLETNLTRALMEAKKAGYWAAGTVVEGGEDLNKVSLPFPLCLVLGSEGTGIRCGLQKHLDLKITLPMRGAQLSFNVAMACAIFCHEIAKQRGA
ncbi:MAG: 23S rRNA (guanosine(2251)-2'-O)-methyltransferase RlmB [Nitrospirae bacterium]|nr:23S rRNA (guanosine(2251)-2'-O)-methyltransferase RlmB [Nitrospirota bacterium]